MHCLFLLGSSRRDGNTERLARLAATSLPANALHEWLRVDDHPLPEFVDVRHGAGFGRLDATARALADATLACTDLVFAVPTYWYTVPASTKRYLDHWSHWMRVPELDFKARMAKKTLWVITVNADELGAPSTSSAPLLASMRMTADYLSMKVGGVLVGHANRPGDIEQDRVALEQAKSFFRAP
jgi:NAD(P)H-dependent FMN reductase